MKLAPKKKLKAFSSFLRQTFRDLMQALGLAKPNIEYCIKRYFKGQEQYGLGNWIAGSKYRAWDELIEEAADGVNISIMEFLRTGNNDALKLLGLFGRALQLAKGEDIPLLVYISHPYSDDPETNVKKVKQLAIEVMRRGHIPIPVHLMFHTFDTETNGELSEKHFLEVDLWLLNLCDVILIAGISPGVLLEFVHAAKLGKKIINSPEELPPRKWDTTLLKRYLR